MLSAASRVLMSVWMSQRQAPLLAGDRTRSSPPADSSERGPAGRLRRWSVLAARTATIAASANATPMRLKNITASRSAGHCSAAPTVRAASRVRHSTAASRNTIMRPDDLVAG
jgi:hypothetical protein